jgi:hypothetical protein
VPQAEFGLPAPPRKAYMFGPNIRTTMKTTLTLLTLVLFGSASADQIPTLEPREIITAPAEGWDIFFGGCSWYCGAPAIMVTASSFLTEREDLKHPAKQAHDSKMGKVWSEGVEGAGLGEGLTFTFRTTKENTTDLGVTSCAIGIGHQGSKTLFQENAKPKVLELRVDGKPKALLHLQDTMGLQRFEIPKLALERPSQHSITLKIIEVFPGIKHEDTCIAEVYFQGTGDMH